MQHCSAIGLYDCGTLYVLLLYIFLPGKPVVAQKLQKYAKKCVLSCTVLWPVIVNKTIMQQNRIKSLHHNGNQLEQKRRCSNIPGLSPPIACPTRLRTEQQPC